MSETWRLWNRCGLFKCDMDKYTVQFFLLVVFSFFVFIVNTYTIYIYINMTKIYNFFLSYFFDKLNGDQSSYDDNFGSWDCFNSLTAVFHYLTFF